jgi:O-antigen ligase
MITTDWAHSGKFISRPEITIDQNFQIFYLFPVALSLFLPFRPIRSLLAIVASIGAIYILLNIQTRSGLLAFILLIFFTLSVPILYKKYGRLKIVIIGLSSLLLVVVSFGWIMDMSANIIIRFTEKDSLASAYGRLYSSLYIFEHIFDINSWIPQGNEGFIKLHKDVPHSNPTAMFLEGGILSLIMWFVIFLVPVIRLGLHFIKRRLDSLSIIIFLAGCTSLLVQLTLNVPFYEQTWLWAGAVIGTLHRINDQKLQTKKL